jgi:hypothetical protein
MNLAPGVAWLVVKWVGWTAFFPGSALPYGDHVGVTRFPLEPEGDPTVHSPQSRLCLDSSAEGLFLGKINAAGADTVQPVSRHEANMT